MQKQSSLQHIADARGDAAIGFLAADVLYVRLRGHISESVGQRYAQTLAVSLEAVSVLRLFKDCSQLLSCELLARSATVRVMLAHRRKLLSMLVLTGGKGITLSNHHLDTNLESSVEYTTELAVFEARLSAISPLPRQHDSEAFDFYRDSQRSGPRR